MLWTAFGERLLMGMNMAGKGREATGLHDPRCAPEVHLHLFARGALDAPERRVDAGSELVGEALYRLIAACEGVVAYQVLVNALKGKAARQADLYLGREGAAVALPSRTKSRGRNGWFCFSRERLRPEGRNGWF